MPRAEIIYNIRYDVLAAETFDQLGGTLEFSGADFDADIIKRHENWI